MIEDVLFLFYFEFNPQFITCRFVCCNSEPDDSVGKTEFDSSSREAP